MYERFTDRARKVMQFANQEAQRFHHEYIGTEHILLGIAKEGEGIAANVLKNLDICLRKILREVEAVIRPGPEDTFTMGKLPQTNRARMAIQYAIEEAKVLGHNYVGTEHLLLGLLREGEGTAGQILQNLGVTLENVRQEILRLLGGKASEEAAKLAKPLLEAAGMKWQTFVGVSSGSSDVPSSTPHHLGTVTVTAPGVVSLDCPALLSLPPGTYVLQAMPALEVPPLSDAERQRLEEAIRQQWANPDTRGKIVVAPSAKVECRLSWKEAFQMVQAGTASARVRSMVETAVEKGWLDAEGNPIPASPLKVAPDKDSPTADAPQLITAPDEQQRCCLLLDGTVESRCLNRTRYWVGKNGVDDYTHCCEQHLEEVFRPGDAIQDMQTGMYLDALAAQWSSVAPAEDKSKDSPPADTPEPDHTVNFREFL